MSLHRILIEVICFYCSYDLSPQYEPEDRKYKTRYHFLDDNTYTLETMKGKQEMSFIYY